MLGGRNQPRGSRDNNNVNSLTHGPGRVNSGASFTLVVLVCQSHTGKMSHIYALYNEYNNNLRVVLITFPITCMKILFL